MEAVESFLESSSGMTKQRNPHRKNPRRSAYDDALIRAKIENRTVDIVLALDLPVPDSDIVHVPEEGTIAAKVCHVDTYAVQFNLSTVGNDRKVWISKAFIVAVYE